MKNRKALFTAICLMSVLVFLAADVLLFCFDVELTFSNWIQLYFHGSTESLLAGLAGAVLGLLLNCWGRWGAGEYDIRAMLTSTLVFGLTVYLILDAIVWLWFPECSSSEFLLGDQAGMHRSGLAGFLTGAMGHHWIAVGGAKQRSSSYA